MRADRIHTMAKNIADTTYDKLPSDVVEVTKKLVMDTLAVSLCGSTGEGIDGLLKLLMSWGGKAESTIWVYGVQLPCVNAAQVNATMAHASDYDDTHDPSPVHTGVTAVPTAFGIAEMLGGIDGKKLITALALGVDMIVRLGMACKIPIPVSGWHYTALHGNFGAAAVAGKLIELDEAALVNALGLAYHQAGGNLQCMPDGALAKRMGPGFAVRNGITAALMAQKGITGAQNVLEGFYGLFNTYHRGEYNSEVLTENLGKRYLVTELSFKPYPCGRLTHPAIDATLALKNNYKIKAEDVKAVTIRVSKHAMEEMCEPLSIKRNPRNIVDAQFSIPWVVAVAIIHGKVGLGSFTKHAIQDKNILMLTNKVIPEIDESLNKRGVTPAIVQIENRDGKVYHECAKIPYGSPQNPISSQALVEKFRDCASYAVKGINSENTSKLIELISRLEDINDVRQVIHLMTGSE